MIPIAPRSIIRAHVFEPQGHPKLALKQTRIRGLWLGIYYRHTGPWRIRDRDSGPKLQIPFARIEASTI
jgi:hypothetical protein